MIVTIARKPRAHARADRTNLHARTAGIRTDKHLCASGCRNEEHGRGNQTKYKFIHKNLQYFVDLALHINARRAVFVQDQVH
jgi:hypothetical protein